MLKQKVLHTRAATLSHTVWHLSQLFTIWIRGPQDRRTIKRIMGRAGAYTALLLGLT